MRQLNKPNFNHAAVYAACTQDLQDAALAEKFNAVATQVVSLENGYEQLATQGLLFNWPSHPQGNDAATSIPPITRGEFKWLYTSQLAKDGRPARNYYNQIRVLASNNICPYCGFCSVETVDHFLPKANYSSLSVLPLNLVPSCTDCNKIKHSGPATAENLASHPYFEHPCVFEDEWLWARIIQSETPIVEFYVAPPITWNETTKLRVQNHFKSLALARRYSTQAAERLIVHAAGISEVAKSTSQEDMNSYLQRSVRIELRLGKNSWQAALAKAIVNDIWFRTEGYLRLL